MGQGSQPSRNLGQLRKNLELMQAEHRAASKSSPSPSPTSQSALEATKAGTAGVAAFVAVYYQNLVESGMPMEPAMHLAGKMQDNLFRQAAIRKAAIEAEKLIAKLRTKRLEEQDDSAEALIGRIEQMLREADNDKPTPDISGL